MLPEIAYSDISSMSDADLDRYIFDLREYCRGGRQMPKAIKFQEAMPLLQIALAEKNSRVGTKQIDSSNKLATETLKLSKITLVLVWFGVVIAIVGVVFAFVQITLALGYPAPS